MSKKPIPTTEPTSLTDAGYKLALAGETTMTLARYVLAQCPSFLDEVPKEVRSALYAGFQLRKHELTGSQYYKLTSEGALIPLTTVPSDATGIVEMTINSAMSYSQQEFGKMAQTDPQRHAVIKELRKKFSNYAGNAMSDLTARIRQLVNEGKPRERSPNKGFREAMTLVFDTYDKRVKTSKDRGDTEADPLKYRLAVDAFWRTYNAG